MQAPPA